MPTRDTNRPPRQRPVERRCCSRYVLVALLLIATTGVNGRPIHPVGSRWNLRRNGRLRIERRASTRATMHCRPEPCNDRARAIEQRFQLDGAQPSPVIRVMPKAPDFQLTLEPKPRGPGRDVRRERPWVIGAVLPDVPYHPVAIGERCLFHASSRGKLAKPDCNSSANGHELHLRSCAGMAMTRSRTFRWATAQRTRWPM